MKIKTSSLTKTAPSPPPMAAEAGQPQYPQTGGRRGRKCCATWSCCDILLLVILVVGVSAVGSFGIGLKWLSNHKGHSYFFGPDYYPATCKVSEIIKQGQVCCGTSCANGKPGMQATLHDKEWYKFKDQVKDPLDEDIRRGEWEEFEEHERGAWEHWEEEWMTGHRKSHQDRSGESHEGRHGDSSHEDSSHEDSSHEDSYEDRKKRSVRGGRGGRPESFECYKIVIEGCEGCDDLEPGFDELKGEENLEDSNGKDSSEKDSAEDQETLEEARRRKCGAPRHHQPRNGSHHDGHHGEHHRDHHGGRHRRQVPSEEETHRRMEEKKRLMAEKESADLGLNEEDFETPEELREDFRPEHGVLVLGDDNDEKKGIYKSMFYDTEYTATSYAQCSYSACVGRKCRSSSTVDIEQKMKKWFAREKTGETFDCFYADNTDNGYVVTNHKYSHKAFHIARKLLIPVVGFLFVIFIVLVVKRCRACKLRCAAARAGRAQAAQQTTPSAPEKYVVPDTDGEVKLTKEQEANLPPVSRMVWTTELPDYEKATELPPEYKSSPDLKAVTEENAVAPVENVKTETEA